MKGISNKDLLNHARHVAAGQLTGFYGDKYKQDIEDACGDIALSILNNPSLYISEEGSLGNYYFAAARNRFLTIIKSKEKLTSLEEITESTEVRDCCPESFIEYCFENRENCRLDVEWLSTKLPEDYRDIIIKFNLEGKPLEVAAKEMNKSFGAVKMLHRRALDKCRDILCPPHSKNRANKRK